MSKFELLFVTLLAVGSTSALAEGGSERSQAFWKEFRTSQERIHGSASTFAGTNKAPAADVEATGGKPAKG
ncbi:hypothetical protein D3C76_757850 [compost metagenome]